MQFKIDTKENYSLIIPESEVLDANMAEGIKDKCAELAENGSDCYIIDLTPCTEGNSGISAFQQLLQLHEDCYSNGRTLVFTGVYDGLLQEMKQQQMHLSLNITPTMQEAIDIVNMEVLERDLFNEEA